MIKSILLTCSISLFSLTAFGQGVIQGSITDDHNEALVGATLVVDGTIAQTADRDGKFKMTGIKTGDHTLSATFVGFESQNIAVKIDDGKTNTLSISLLPGKIQLADVVISSSADRPVNTLSQMDIKLRPVNTAQDVLRMVPGLFIAQHAGGGKAEQIFLRGFDCDHGTDINVEVDGLPVNMVSHAHGQGYADLHFLMPEAIGYVDFDKGPYFANKGDLTTAGYVLFVTKKTLDRNFLKLEGGMFNSGRIAAGVNVLKTKKSTGYITGETYHSDGYFKNSQQFYRFNVQGKFTTQLSLRDVLTFGFSGFDSHWNASGQIPTRAVDDGSISRFGSIDPTEGGKTSRFNMWARQSHAFDNGATLENQVYAIRYDFNLFSNFTFFLNDSVNGDQINQREGRWVYGYKTNYQQNSSFLGLPLKTDIGAGMRYDVINNIALNHTVKRQFLNHVQFGDVRELNANAYVSETISLTDKLSLNAALRLDEFYFSYYNKLTATQRPSVNKAIVNPKFNLTYQVSDRVSVFMRSGTGFHSNDARVVIQQAGVQTLPRAYAFDLGSDLKLTPRLFVHTALWRLDLDQEFVYSGDDGIVEPQGKTKRMGADVSMRYQLTPWLFADVDYTLSNPRFKNLPEGQNYVPLAPTKSSIGGLTIRRGYGFNGSLRYRTIGNRPANNDNSLVATGYFICDAVVNYVQKSFEVGLSVENIFNTAWKEAQFDTVSRLRNETAAVDQINFTPGTPFSLKLRVVKYF